jgi:hypothetical protein
VLLSVSDHWATSSRILTPGDFNKGDRTAPSVAWEASLPPLRPWGCRTPRARSLPRQAPPHVQRPYERVDYRLDPIRHPAKYAVKNLVREVHRFLNRVPRGNHFCVDLSLPRKPQPRDDARAEVDQRAIDSRQTGIGVEHSDSVGEQTANVTRDGLPLELPYAKHFIYSIAILL